MNQVSANYTRFEVEKTHKRNDFRIKECEKRFCEYRSGTQYFFRIFVYIVFCVMKFVFVIYV